MDDGREILLIAERRELAGYVGRLPRIGFRARSVASLHEAEEIVGRYVPAVHAALFPTSFDFDLHALTLERVRKSAASARLRLLAIGDPPDATTREALRRTGVDFLLSEPISDGELRFFLNAATWPARRGDSRRSLRVPTELVARVHAATGTRMAPIFNLSATGAYLETPRPSQQHAHLDVEIPLPSGPLRLRSRVTLTNVAGNVRRDNLPPGMGVRFVEATADERASLERYVEDRAARYRP